VDVSFEETMRPAPATKRVKQHRNLDDREGWGLLYDQDFPGPQSSSGDIGGDAPTAVETRAQWLEREIMPHETLVRRTLRGSHDRAEIDEIIQAAYLRLMATKQILRDKDGAAYFYLAARSEILDRRRRAQTRKAVGHYYFEDIYDLAEELAADQPTPEDVLDSKRSLEQFRAALEDLPPRERKVFELRRFEGLRPCVVAERLGIAQRTVELDQARAIHALTKVMARGPAAEAASDGLRTARSSARLGRGRGGRAPLAS
jgi:RNA polymerase sigma-70 factor (ECF subfamily)